MTAHIEEASAQDLENAWMQEAILLATTSVANGGGPFGALVAKDGQVVATGNNRVTSTLDPVAHAEVTALRNACQELNTFSLEGCTLITSCEPCPMCLTSSLWARVDRLVFAADRNDAAIADFDDRRFYELFEKKPSSMWPMTIDRLDLPNRNAPFEAWRAKTDRVAY